MNDSFYFLLFYLLTYACVNSLSIYYSLQEIIVFYILFFIPFFRDSIYFVLEFILLRKNVVFDTTGGELEMKDRQILVLLEAKNNDTVEGILETLKLLKKQKLEYGDYYLCIVNNGKIDCTSFMNMLNPFQEVETPDHKNLLFMSGKVEEVDMFYVHYQNKINIDQSHLLGLIIKEIEYKHLLRFDMLLHIKGSSKEFNENMTQRLSNIILANPRVSFVCGLDIEMNSFLLTSKLTQSGVMNKIGKYNYINSSNIIMFNLEHPSILKSGFQTLRNSKLINYSERTWGLVDIYSYSVSDKVTFSLNIVDIVDQLICRNPMLSLLGLLDLLVECLGFYRIAMIVAVFTSDLVYQKHEEWIRITIFVVLSIASLFWFINMLKMFKGKVLSLCIFEFVFKLIYDVAFPFYCVYAIIKTYQLNNKK